MIPYGKHRLTNSDIFQVVKVLKSEFLTQGIVVPEFEKAITNYCGVKYGVATNSATSALHIACLALGVQPGDQVWTSVNSFVASANCAIYCGANIDFIDIDDKTYNLSIEFLENKLKRAEKIGKLPKVIIAVHFAGQSCEMDKIFQLSKKYGFRIIEDASHAIGAKYKSKLVGCCEYSDITIFSFHPVKIITTGEGGMAVTNNHELHELMKQLRTHGISYEINKEHYKNFKEIWNYQQLNLGFNYRLTDFQAALGINQLKQINNFVRERRLIAKNYDNLLSNSKLILPWQHPDNISSYHLYPIRIVSDRKNIDQNYLYNHLRKNGIGVNIHYIPIHLQPYFRKKGFKRGDFPRAEKYFKETISLPIYPSLKSKFQKRIIEILSNV